MRGREQGSIVILPSQTRGDKGNEGYEQRQKVRRIAQTFLD
jgi:hypothetical protein